MQGVNITRNILVTTLCLLILCGCQSYKSKVIPFKTPDAYPLKAETAGASLGFRLYEDSAEAERAFGFDIRSADVLPVQIAFDNKGMHPIQIVPEKCFIIDSENDVWPILDSSLVYDRIAKKTELGRVAPEATKVGLLGSAAGVLIGAAVGVVTGQNVGTAILQGAAVGAAAGATMGGAKALIETDAQKQIKQDLDRRTLENRMVNPNELAYGFLFFPGEAGKIKELRLNVKEVDTGNTHALTLKIN